MTSSLTIYQGLKFLGYVIIILKVMKNELLSNMRQRRELSSELPSREMVVKQAFSIVSNAIHFGHNSGLSVVLVSKDLDFISLQLTRISSTFEKIAEELESNLFVVCRVSESVRSTKSLWPILGAFTSAAMERIGFNNLIKKLTQFGDSRR